MKFAKFLLFFIIIPTGLFSQALTPKYDLSKVPVLYTVGYAHLDTEWRWDYQETVNEYLKSTLDDNFAFFDKYKDYVFTFSGARRYKMMKEYYPERYLRMKKYISQNRWYVGGSSVDECDANIPSPESILRQILYGNNWFRKEYNKESVDFLLPDCFGFQESLPSVLAHAGLLGFSTQKLGWGSAVGIPFNLGNWNGPDGKGIIAALNGTSYSADIEGRIDTMKYWVNRVMNNGEKYGVLADFRYYGTGDVGGAPREIAIKNGLASMNNPDSRIKIYFSSSDQIFRDLTPLQKSNLPKYSGDLLLTQHSAGSLTSQAYMKRWNRKNELLAQSAEPLAATASWLGGIAYPTERLNNAWWLVLGSQMHDILPGTCIPRAYEFAWNDEVLAMNTFAGVLESSAGVVMNAMDTRVTGIPLVVYNPVAIDREDVVEAEIDYPNGTPSEFAVFGPDGNETPSQVLSKTKNSARILFLANVPSMGLACYDVRPAEKASVFTTSMSSGPSSLENEFYKVVINSKGDISSIIDKKQNREILSAPSRLELRAEHPKHWPAWNMDWADRNKPATAYVSGNVKMNFIENGPVRSSFRVERTFGNSRFIQFVRLTAGKSGKRVEVKNTIEWQTKGMSLKAFFPLTATSRTANYNSGLGIISRSTNNEKKYEVPSREWFDLTDKSETFGVSILEDCKFGSDKPDDKTLRLTLLYTPVTNFYHDQATQDFGTHEITYAIYSHEGDWKRGQTEWQGRMLNQPLVAFRTVSHPGSLGNSISMAKVSVPQVDIRAIKKSENTNQFVVRLQELFGQDARHVEVTLPGKILSGQETDGQERVIGDATITGGKLVVDMTRFAIRTFSLTLAPPAATLPQPVSFELPLVYDQDVVSTDINRKNGGVFTTGGYGIPAEQFPAKLTVDGIEFRMGSPAEGQFNALAAKGQKIKLPEKKEISKIYILAASVKDTSAVFKTGKEKTNLRIQAYTGKIGQFDNRIWDKYGRLRDLKKGYIRRDPVAWYSTHLHQDTINVPYEYAYIYKYSVEAEKDAEYIQLPDNPDIKIFAITAAVNNYDNEKPVQPLYDDFSGRKAPELVLPARIVTEDLVPLAKVKMIDDNSDLNKLPLKLTMKDYADMHMPAGVTTKYYSFGTEKKEGYMPAQGSPVSSAVDGMFDIMPTDSAKDVWFEKGESRIVMDLQKGIEIDSIHMFTSISLARGAQAFSVWASDKEQCPSVEGDPKASGWNFVMYSPPIDVWGNNKAVYSVVPEENKTLHFRYLMWVSEESLHGPFYFREIDVFDRQN